MAWIAAHARARVRAPYTGDAGGGTDHTYFETPLYRPYYGWKGVCTDRASSERRLCQPRPRPCTAREGARGAAPEEDVGGVGEGRDAHRVPEQHLHGRDL